MRSKTRENEIKRRERGGAALRAFLQQAARLSPYLLLSCSQRDFSPSPLLLYQTADYARSIELSSASRTAVVSTSAVNGLAIMRNGLLAANTSP